VPLLAPVGRRRDMLVVREAGVMNGALLNAKEAGALLSVPHTWVLAEARADRIPHVRLGRYVRFDHDQLLAWALARQRGPVRAVMEPSTPADVQ
jgi:excisionase family DNA binding protein